MLAAPARPPSPRHLLPPPPPQGASPEGGAPSVAIRAERNLFTFGAPLPDVAERAASPDWIPPYREDKGALGADGLALRSGIESGPEGEARRDSVDRDERRLGELGRKTVEMLAIAHIFCEKLEVGRGRARGGGRVCVCMSVCEWVGVGISQATVACGGLARGPAEHKHRVVTALASPELA